MRPHLTWILPVLMAAASYVLAGFVAEVTRESDPLQAVLLAVAALVLGLVVPAVCLVFAIRNGYRVFRAHRRSRGHFTRSEALARERERQHLESYSSAAELLRILGTGQVPPALDVWGVVLRPGERALLHLPAEYARFYGGPGAYTHVNGFYWGSPVFMLAGYGLTALGNRSRRKAAEAAAASQWREQQLVDVIATDQRLLCQVDGQWLAFDYARVTACYPEPEQHSLVFEFPDTSPLLIGGASSPLIAAVAVWALHGPQGVHRHPALAGLRSQR